MTVALGWYFHLPACASAFEVGALVDENLSLLVDAHERAAVPVTLAVTGCLLERLARDHAHIVERVQRGVEGGWIDIAATAFHEVCAPLLPFEYLVLQVHSDIELKQRLFGRRPLLYWPGNLAWTPSFERVLPTDGIQRCVVDEQHIRAARETQLWHWLRDNVSQLGTTLIDTAWDEDVAHLRYRLEPAGMPGLDLVIRSRAVQSDLSFGTHGAMHRAWDDTALDAVARRLEDWADDDNCLVFSGDDGDRVNPVSIHQYRRLLDQVGKRLGTSASATSCDGRIGLEFLPAFMPGGSTFWRDDTACAYLTLLDDIYRLVDRGSLTPFEVLPLQDVFPLFWKRLARTRWFYERAWALLERAR